MENEEFLTSFPNLPSEVVAHIFLFLPYSTLKRARLICKQWYEASLDHRILDNETLVIDQCSLISEIKESNRHFFHLGIRDENSLFRDEDFWLKVGPRLKSLHLGLCSVREIDLLSVFIHCPKLKHLEVINCKILISADEHLSEDTLPDLVNLQSLKIVGYDSPHSNYKLFQWVGAKAPNLRTIVFVDCLADSRFNLSQGLTCEHIWSFFENKSDCVFDVGFDVSKEYMYDDELVKLASLPNVRVRILNTNFLPKPIYSTCQLWVRVLVLKALLSLDDSMFESICNNFPNLQELTLDDMSEITVALRKLSLLKNVTVLSLSIVYGHVIESDLFAGLCSEVNMKLREFHLQIANDMSSTFYVEFARTHPALTSLNLSTSESLDDWTIQAFFKYQVFLEYFSIREVNAVDVGWLGAEISAPLNKEEKENPTGFAIFRLKGLRMLDLSSSLINVRILEHIVAKLPTLEILRIERLPVTDDFLAHIAKKLPCLTEVYVYGCQRITKTGIKLLNRRGVMVLR